jgi:hypothetical protein
VAVELGVRRADGRHEIALVQRADELRDRLGVGLRGELLAACLEGLAQLGVVLDDAVQHDLDAAARVVVRVGVGLADAPVGRPSGVADAGRRRRLVRDGDHRPGASAGARAGRGESWGGLGARDGGAQAGEVADRAHAIEAAVTLERDARRVVAAVLERRQAVEQQRPGRTVADVSDDSAHGGGVFLLVGCVVERAPGYRRCPSACAAA